MRAAVLRVSSRETRGKCNERECSSLYREFAKKKKNAIRQRCDSARRVDAPGSLASLTRQRNPGAPALALPPYNVDIVTCNGAARCAIGLRALYHFGNRGLIGLLWRTLVDVGRLA